MFMFILGLIDLTAGVIGFIAKTGFLIKILNFFLTLIVLKGIVTLATSRPSSSPFMFFLGLIDLISGIAGIISISGYFSGFARIFFGILIMKGLWTTATCFVSG